MATPPGRALNDTATRGFDLLARRYDTPWIQRWVYRPPQDAILEELRARGSRRIVDVGCGTGILADRIQRELRPDEVMGVDPSEAALALGVIGLRMRFPGSQVSPGRDAGRTPQEDRWSATRSAPRTAPRR
jgi:SAM-dependent methyltransferase